MALNRGNRFTPIAVNREKGEYWMRPANWGGGRGRTSSEIDMAYLHYRWKKRLDFAKSEGSALKGICEWLYPKV